MTRKTDPLRPSDTLLVKLGSLAIHAEEFISPGRHEVDLAILRTLLADGEVREWLKAMVKLAFLPKKRRA